MDPTDYSLVFAIILAFFFIPAARRLFSVRLLDHPNNRSSHFAPRSRAGGAGFGFAWFAACGVLAAFGIDLLGPAVFPDSEGIDLSSSPARTLAIWFLLGAIIIWLNGLLDDFFQLPARYRIIMQALGVAAGILGPDVFREGLHPFLLVLVFLGLVYFINAFNFMDGTDGLAASEGIFILVAVFFLGQERPALSALAIVLSVFLFWNLPRARIFMGDAGSNLIGYVAGYALLLVFLEKPALAFLIPVLFTVDATLTLIVRLFRKEPFYLAHRNHAYQHLARKWGHGPVLAGLWGANAAIMMIMLLLDQTGIILTVSVVLIVHFLIGAVLYLVGAGRPGPDF